MANQWFKFYGGDYLSDPKIERLSPLERSCWITILCMASMTDKGVIDFLTVESLLNRSGIHFDPYHPEEWEKALSILVKLENLKMIETNDDGQVIVINWSKRQEHNLTVAERVAKSRKNKRDVTTNVTNVTSEENRIEENRIEENRIEERDSKTFATTSRRTLSFKKINTGEQTEEPFKIAKAIQQLKESPQRHIQFIGEYFEEKKLNFANKKQFDIALKRHLKDAAQLAAFSDKEIGEATAKAEKEYPDYTLGTLIKILTR